MLYNSNTESDLWTFFFYIWSFACFATAGKNKLTYDAKLKPGYLSVGGAI